MIHTHSMALCLAVAEHTQHTSSHQLSLSSWVAWYWSNMKQQPIHENIDSDIFSEWSENQDICLKPTVWTIAFPRSWGHD